jgi:hypothetical protein
MWPVRSDNDVTLVASDHVWNLIPASQTTAARILAGDLPHRARPTWDQPQPHANNAAAVVVSLYRMEATRHADYSMASSTLNTILLASVGEKNRNHLKTTFPALKLYMLSPREIVETMRAKHGVATSDDVSRLRDPLSRALRAPVASCWAQRFRAWVSNSSSQGSSWARESLARVWVGLMVWFAAIVGWLRWMEEWIDF